MITTDRLRALLIHKGTKLRSLCWRLLSRLRALLIHKGTKLYKWESGKELV